MIYLLDLFVFVGRWDFFRFIGFPDYTGCAYVYIYIYIDLFTSGLRFQEPMLHFMPNV